MRLPILLGLFVAMTPTTLAAESSYVGTWDTKYTMPNNVNTVSGTPILADCSGLLRRVTSRSAASETQGLRTRGDTIADALSRQLGDVVVWGLQSNMVAQRPASRGRAPARAQNNTQRPGTNRNAPEMTTEALLRRAPEGVQVVPDIAYREGHPRWKLDLAMPEAPSPEPRPAIVFVHGGGWRNGDKRRAAFIGPALEFASKGYVCISVNYRLISPQEGVDIDSCIEDVKCAVRWLRAHAGEYNVDPARFGAYGNSAGAHLVAMLGLCPTSAGLEGDGPWQGYSSMVQAVVCSATPASWLMPMNNRQQRPPTAASPAVGNQPARPSFPQRSEELKKKISPLTYVSADAPAFLIIHDASDRTVFVRHGDALHEALQAVGTKEATYLRFDNGTGHGSFLRNIATTGPAREAFFARTLKHPPQ